MARTGSALVIALASAVAIAAPEPEITMQADREKVGTEDTFRLEIAISNAPEGSKLALPDLKSFEKLGESSHTNIGYTVGPGGAGHLTQVQKHTLTLRANQPGTLTIGPAQLITPSGTLNTRPIKLTVVTGRLAPDRPQSQPYGTPFGLPPGFFGGDLELPFDEPTDVPRGDSDLFVRATLDKTEAYVGEQVMLSVHLYARIDVSAVESVSMPKLDGFLSQDFKTPAQLSAVSRSINGVPYREYLFRQRAVFPLKPGTVTIEPTEADITAGTVFTGRRVHRKSNELKLLVRPLPPGPATSIVGRWRLWREVSQTEVALGEPVQVKLVLEGRGNLQGVTLPPLDAPAAFKTFDPEVTDKPNNSRTQVGGTRVVEYTLVPQQTGTFTLPGLTVPYFDPEQRRYDELKVDPVTLTVKSGAGGAQVQTSPTAPNALDPAPKNQLVAGGLKSLRHTARFSTPERELSAQPWFLPVSLAPLVLSLLAGAFWLARQTIGPESAQSQKNKQARAARKRLAAAQKLLVGGSTGDFYVEVERALTSFMSARLGTPVAGLTRDALLARLTEAGVSPSERTRITQVLETCDLGRYAPGLGEAAARQRALEDAAAAMEGWS